MKFLILGITFLSSLTASAGDVLKTSQLTELSACIKNARLRVIKHEVLNFPDLIVMTCEGNVAKNFYNSLKTDTDLTTNNFGKATNVKWFGTGISNRKAKCDTGPDASDIVYYRCDIGLSISNDTIREFKDK